MNYSQASQDLFVLGIVNQPGYYLEIGGSNPVGLNNTYLLEQKGWDGVSVDNDEGCTAAWAQHRKNTFIKGDACSLDYNAILEKKGFTRFMDYLSIDIDEATNLALKNVPFNFYSFKVITIEHDTYRLKDFLRPKQRTILEDAGYVRVCSDVLHDKLPYEDWWLHLSVYDAKKHPMLQGLDHAEIIKIYGFD